MKSLSKTEIAVMTSRTLFPNKLTDTRTTALGKSERIIKRSTNVKLGKVVSKGKFKGFKIFTVTLEERATCPKSCAHWADCYGNNMPFATRYVASDDLTDRMEAELVELQRKNPNGFLVRLHILGDFYSVAYVAKWAKWLTQFPALNVYGYTANQPNAIDPVERAIGQAVMTIQGASPERFAIRLSGNHDVKDMSALSMDDPRSAPSVEAKEAFICPVQLDKVTSCGACGLCWSALKPVVFLTH